MPHVKHDYFSSFNQSDHCLLASWSLPYMSKITSSFLRREYCFALLTVNSLGRSKERKDLVSYCLVEVAIVSHITYASSVCYKSAFNKLKLHVIALDKVKELIYRSFFVNSFTRNKGRYEMIIANLVLLASLTTYHLISNVRSWNNC